MLINREWTAVQKEMLRRGFLTEGTGGGCEAFIRYGEFGSVWVTVEDDPSIPESFCEAVTVGVYPKNDEDSGGMALAMMHFPTLNEALERLTLTDAIAPEAVDYLLRECHAAQVMLNQSVRLGRK